MEERTRITRMKRKKRERERLSNNPFPLDLPLAQDLDFLLEFEKLNKARPSDT
jgi:hypothetical protein